MRLQCKYEEDFPKVRVKELRTAREIFQQYYQRNNDGIQEPFGALETRNSVSSFEMA